MVVPTRRSRSALRKVRETPAWDRHLRQVQRRDPARHGRIIRRLVRAAWLTGHDDALFWGPPIGNRGRHEFCEAPWRGYSA